MGLTIILGERTAPVLRIDLQTIIKFVGHWLYVPGILIFLLAFSVHLTLQRTAEDEERWSNFMGLVVGGLIFASVMVLDALGVLGKIGLLESSRRVPYLAVGAGAGFVLLALADKFLTTKTRSFFIVPVSAASLCGIYFDLVDEQYRDPILLFTLGLILGLAVYAWLFPRVFRALLGLGSSSRIGVGARGGRR